MEMTVPNIWGGKFQPRLKAQKACSWINVRGYILLYCLMWLTPTTFLLIEKPHGNWFICIENLVRIYTLLNFLSDPTHPGSNWFLLFLFHQKISKHSCSVYMTYGILKNTWFLKEDISFFDTLITLTLFYAGDGIFWLWESIPCLLMTWILTSPEHQQTWYSLCETNFGVALEVV